MQHVRCTTHAKLETDLFSNVTVTTAEDSELIRIRILLLTDDHKIVVIFRHIRSPHSRRNSAMDHELVANVDR